MGWISGEQLERDHRGLRNACCACGRDGAERNPLILSDEGLRIHSSHYDDPDPVFRRQNDIDEDVA